MRRQTSRLDRLVVASDGQPAADAALRFAKLIAERDGSAVEVVGVYSPRVAIPPPMEGGANPRREQRHAVKEAELLARVERQVRDRIQVDWRIHVRVGHAPWVIAEVARSARADLIILGHPARSVDGPRRPGRHTPEQLACMCEVPVLAVRPDTHGLPRIAVAVVDQSEASSRAAQVAERLLAPGGTLLRVRKRVPAAVLGLAVSLGADLIAVPLPGSTFEVRSLLCGGAVDVLDHSPCSVLVAPSLAIQGERPSKSIQEPEVELSGTEVEAIPSS